MSNLKDLVVTDWTRYGNILIVEAQDTLRNVARLLVYKGLTFDALLNLGRLPAASLLYIEDNTTESWVKIRTLCKELEPKVCPCCMKRSGSSFENYFKVTSYLWNKYSIAYTKRNHMMCLECFEDRVGRKLQSDDFSTSLLNKINPYYMQVVKKEILVEADAS